MKLAKLELESKVEADICAYAQRRGWWSAKFVSPGQTGVPDRLFIRRGRHVFIEVKRLREVPTAKQLNKHDEMRAYGAEVHWVDNVEEAMEILK